MRKGMPPPTTQSRSNGASSSRAGGGGDKDKQKADLLCKAKYSNTMPDIPFDAKFLACPFVDISRFVDYKPTSLEKNYKWDILTEGDLGVKIDLINPDTYHIDYTTEVRMDPADERLLEDDVSNPQNFKRSQQHSKVVPWMRKTEYISSEFNRFGTSSDRQETKVGYNIKKRLNEENVYRDRDSQMAAIERTFEQVRAPAAAHYSKPNVFAVQELPVLPDFDLWKLPFAQVIFDSDPSPADMPPNAQTEKMSQALIRGMMDEMGEQFVAYFLPTDETLAKRRRDAADQQQFRQDEVYEYKMWREYNWTVKNKATKGYEQENYFFLLRDDGVFYDELETRVRLNRRRAREGAPRTANSRLVVRHRLDTPAELAQQHERYRALAHQPDEEPPVDPDDDADDDGDDDGAIVLAPVDAPTPPPVDDDDAVAAADDEPNHSSDDDDD